MEDIILEKGFSYYGDTRVSDIDLCNLVGLETYKALYTLFPDNWVEITHPMTANKHHLYKIGILLSLQDNITGTCLKKRLVIRFVDGPDQGSSYLIADLINSSECLGIPNMSPFTYAIWIVWMFLMMILTIIILYIYVWPDYNCYHRTCNTNCDTLFSPLNQCNIPIPILKDNI